MKIDRRSVLKYSVSLILDQSRRIGNSITPEEFGAVGDGEAPDGGAFTRLIDYLNGQAKNQKITVVCKGSYSLAGCGEIPYAPIANKSQGGHVIGLPPLYKDFVTFECYESKFIVPKNFDWRRIQKGGGDKDSFFVGFQLYGANCVFRGGVLHGNLSHRKIIRGDAISGFGGNEFGIVLGGDNWRMENVQILEWGTDCVLIGSSGLLNNSVMSKGRRNNLSIVPFYSDCKVEIKNCLFTHAGDWPEMDRNRPGSAIQVEAGRRGFKTVLNVNGSVFIKNRLKDIQLSAGSMSCVLSGNQFSNAVNIRPGSLGGHRIENNIFTDNARMSSIYGGAKDAPILIKENTFSVSRRRAVRVNRSKILDTLDQKPTVILEDNKYNK